jgi:UDP-N-acetylglucosamine 1-carboxyvinyltransferase
MSDSFLIKGGELLQGEIPVYGAKNHALKMFPASLLSQDTMVLENVPQILDVRLMSDIIRDLGGDVTVEGHKVTINTADVKSGELNAELVAKMRASFLFIIPLLHRFGKVVFPHPGGDSIGRRPIDMTLDFLLAMGAEIKTKPYSYEVKSKKRLKGINYTFKWVTHTGTEAIIMAAVLAEGETIIKNAAMEPEVVALAEYLNKAGARIKGAGTPTIVIEGVETLGGGICAIIPDRIEVGTYAILGALCGDPVTVTNCRPDHLDVLWKYFDLMGIKYELGESSVKVWKSLPCKTEQIKTHEYPGFITDIQPPMTLLLTQAEGLGIMHETIYDGRLFFTDLLNKMGADIIMADPHRVFVQGPTKLYGKSISSPDIRAGITLVLAALIAEGESTIANIYHIDRGYEQLEKRLQAIGANIERIKT